MSIVNSVTLVGRIYRAELRQTNNNHSVMNARLGVRDARDKTMTFVDLVFWSTLADRANALLSADERTRVVIEGSLRQDKWTNENGEPRTKLSIKVNRFFALQETDAPEYALGEEEDVI